MDFIRLDQTERTELYPLLGKCFSCWTKYGARDPFPFEMTSFAAKEEGRFAAHCGVVELPVSDGAGNLVTLGGLANVCTDPDFRHRGLAESLCRMAIDFAKDRGYAGMPLFTSFERVYEKNGWWNYPIFMPKLAKWKRAGSPRPMDIGNTLPGEVRNAIAGIYRNGFDFPGKVARQGEDGESIFSWRHHFEKFEFAFVSGCYAAGGGNLVCEMSGDPAAPELDDFLLSLPRENGGTVFLLPESSPFWERIAFLAKLEPADIFFHGPMVQDLDERRFFGRADGIYFPLIDRF